MKHTDKISEENIGQLPELQDLLRESVFYPASGIDGSAIECMGHFYHSFIHVDYSTSEQKVFDAMKNDFFNVGYDLTGPANIPENVLRHVGFQELNWAFSDFETNRLQTDFIAIRQREAYIPFFAIWGLYRLNPCRTGSIRGKSSNFSLLHIGGEACRWFERIYLSNGINPSALAILSPGDGYGDNWTRFIHMDDMLYRLLCFNVQNNGAYMPETVITDKTSKSNPLRWPGYEYVKSEYNLVPDTMRGREIRFYRRVS